jgi:hypothetical protein
VADPTYDPDPGQHSSGRPRSHPAPSGQPHRGKPAATVITDARSASSREISSRIRRYSITMAFRMACFVAMVLVHGWLRWSLLGLAVFLPYIAVVLANQSDQRSTRNEVEQGAPVDAPQLTTGEQVDLIDGEVLEGSVVEDERDEPEGRVA